LNRFYWSIRHRTTNRYHILNIQDKANGYKYGYSDVRCRLIFANFALLKQFVEREMDIVNWESDPEHSHAAKEIRALYHWWLHERPKEWQDYWDEKGGAAAKEWWKEEERLEQKDSDMVKRLMDIRLWLWT
jgi:hypothetical protein